MYPVTHMTIAVGATWLGERLWRRIIGRKTERPDTAPPVTQPVDAPSMFDFRLVAAGALIPDLIDKPLKWYLFPDSLPDSHVYGHTLLLPALIIVAGLVLARRGDRRLLALGLGCLTHPLVDPVLICPRTLFWPALGTEFPDAESFIPFQWGIDLVLVTVGAWLLSRDERFRDAIWQFLEAGSISASRPRAAVAAD